MTQDMEGPDGARAEEVEGAGDRPAGDAALQTRRFGSAAAVMAAEWWADRLEQGDRSKFIAALVPLIDADIAAHGSCRLECDYDPWDHLLTAVRAAGVECRGFMFSARGILPTKHSLWVRPNKLEPKEGYGRWSMAIPVAKGDPNASPPADSQAVAMTPPDPRRANPTPSSTHSKE